MEEGEHTYKILEPGYLFWNSVFYIWQESYTKKPSEIWLPTIPSTMTTPADMPGLMDGMSQEFQVINGFWEERQSPLGTRPSQFM